MFEGGHESTLQSKRVASYKSERYFSVQATQAGTTNLFPPNEPPFDDYPPAGILVRCAQVPTASFLGTFPSLSRRFATSYRSYAPVKTTFQGPMAGCSRSLRPPHLQLFLAHEQSRLSRLTQPGSGFRRFHEKGRVARLRRDVLYYSPARHERALVLKKKSRSRNLIANGYDEGTKVRRITLLRYPVTLISDARSSLKVGPPLSLRFRTARIALGSSVSGKIWSVNETRKDLLTIAASRRSFPPAMRGIGRRVPYGRKTQKLSPTPFSESMRSPQISSFSRFPERLEASSQACILCPRNPVANSGQSLGVSL